MYLSPHANTRAAPPNKHLPDHPSPISHARTRSSPNNRTPYSGGVLLYCMYFTT